MNSQPDLRPTVAGSLRFDLPAGLVVFLVAIPLCLGIALASGAPLVSGLVAGAVGGLVIPLVSRAQLSVSGPAAGLAAVVVAGIATLGSFQAFTVAVILAGVLQILMGALRLGRLAAWFPSGVVGGMLAAIGVLLIMKQLPHAVGFDRDAFVDEESTGIFDPAVFFSAIEPVAAVVAVVAAGAILLWDRTAKYLRATLVPAPLVGVGVAVLVHEIVKTALGQGLSVEHLVAMPDMSAWTSSFALPSASLFTRPDVWGVAVTLAIVASIESLLNVEAIDKLDPFGRRSPMNRELIAQGLGNVASGLLGGLPVTSVVVRSSAALQAGARTRMASFSHGVLILVALVVLGPVLQRIPLAALAALLILTGYKLAGPKVLVRAWKEGPDHFVPFAATLIGVVGLDLLKGVCLGVVVAVILSFRKPLGRATVERRSESDLTIKLEKNVPFFARARIQAALDAVPASGRVVVDAEQATSVHRDVREAMKSFVDGAEKRSIAVELRGLAVS